MKLLICSRCSDVFKLDYDLRQCQCGHVKGRYDANGSTAVTNGNGTQLALGNGDVQRAIYGMSGMDPATPREGYYAPDAPSRLTYAWVRPHSGPGNPHCRVDVDL